MGLRGVAQPGSAPGLGPGCRRFESCRPDNNGKRINDLSLVRLPYYNVIFWAYQPYTKVLTNLHSRLMALLPA